MSEPLVGMPANVDTFPKLLLRNARDLANQPAIREKDFGIWQSWTWSQMAKEVQAIALGLRTNGFKRGEFAAVIGSNRPNLYFSIAAVQSLGGVPVPIHADGAPEEISYVLDHADIVVAIVEDQEQCDKVLQVKDDHPNLRNIYYDEPRGLRNYDEPGLESLKALKDLSTHTTDPDVVYGQEVNRGEGKDLSILLYTSGTTGRAKGVMLTYDNLIHSGQAGVDYAQFTPNDVILAYLPFAWVVDHLFSYCQSYISGYCVACPESADTVLQDLQELGPTFFFAAPRTFEGILTNVTIRMEDAGRVKKAMYDYFIDVAMRVGEDILNGKPVSTSNRFLYWLGGILVYGPMKDVLGLSNVRLAYTGGEAIGPEIFRFYRSLGMNLKQLYGQTEASVYVTVQPDGEIFSDTVGRPMPNVEIKLAENGEVLYRSKGVFAGYYKNDEATIETKNDDGWVHTGDAGFFDKIGHLKIIDRAKDVGKLTSGALFAPKYIENKLKFYPNIKEAVAFGDGRDFCTVFINIDLTAVGNWAERNNVPYASYQELAANGDVYDIISGHVAEVNSALAQEGDIGQSQIKRFLILHKELDADDGELTRTQKVRRRIIAERYADTIEAFYNGSTEHHANVEVTYEDGRKGVISGNLVIRDAKTFPVQVLHEAAE